MTGDKSGKDWVSIGLGMAVLGGLQPAAEKDPVGEKVHYLLALGKGHVVDALLFHEGQGFVEGCAGR